MSNPAATFNRDDAAAPLRSNWGWFIALGVIMLVLGAIALVNLLSATVASVFVIGIAMLVGGLAQIALAFSVRQWSRFFLLLLSGILYAAAGILAFFNPLLASAILTLVFAFSLILAGVVRIAVGFASRPETGWGWMVAAGVITLLAGIVLAIGWPVNSLWVLGFVLAVDLLVQGAAFLAFGIALRGRV